MTVLQIVLIVIVIPLTVINIYNFRTARKNKADSERKYAMVLRNFNLYGHLLPADDKRIIRRFVSDQGNNYLVCIEKAGNRVFIIGEDLFKEIRRDPSLKAVPVISEGSQGRILSVICRISSDETPEPFDIVLGEKPHKKRFLGKFVIETAQEMCDFILSDGIN